MCPLTISDPGKRIKQSTWTARASWSRSATKMRMSKLLVMLQHMPIRMGNEVYFDIASIAERWGTSRQTVWRRDLVPGGLKYTRIGSIKMVSAADLETYEKRLLGQLRSQIKKTTALIAKLEADPPTRLRETVEAISEERSDSPSDGERRSVPSRPLRRAR